jgi:hypothetical protein
MAGAGAGCGVGASAGAPGGKYHPKAGGGDPGGEDESVSLHSAFSEVLNQEAVIHELITIANEPTIAMVIRASVTVLTKAGLKFVPFLPRIIPVLHVIRPNGIPFLSLLSPRRLTSRLLICSFLSFLLVFLCSSVFTLLLSALALFQTRLLACVPQLLAVMF